MHRHERATLDYIEKSLNPGDVFVDIGAHVGYYAEYFGQLVGPIGVVYAFEPHPSNFRLLIRNCRHLPQVKTIQVAVSDSSGEVLLFEHSTSSSSHALTDLSESGKTIPVRRVTLDGWSHENEVDRIDVILIDVEGHELSVIRGMCNIIENNPNIIIIMEYCPSNWTSRREGIDALINEIHKIQLNITFALGQVREFPIPEYVSETDLKNRLSEILDEEMNKERCDYVNIVLRRRA
jgi:FkbM family methyltransferase